MCDCYCEEKKNLKKSEIVFFIYEICALSVLNELKLSLKNNFYSFQKMWESNLKNIDDETIRSAARFFCTNERKFPELQDFLIKCAEISKRPVLISETPKIFINLYRQNNFKFTRNEKRGAVVSPLLKEWMEEQK